ncbi:hypothetical protein EMIT0P258_60260 [Pseudomonas sp. IT-P258]|jgi:hypothetical protein
MIPREPMLAGVLKAEPLCGALPGINEMIARDDPRRCVQCLTAATINTFSLAEECSN